MDKQRTVEQIYQKKTQLEHILLRPDTYVGSIEMTEQNLWILNEQDQSFVEKTIQYVPGLYKIFDEILVNASDNYQRDKSMDTVKVVIDENRNFISVWNNGKGIPIQIHKEHNMYIPEMIFGHLLTGSNYNDDEKKVVGGRNGYGAKLTNIFSKKFVIECQDATNKKYFRMEWRNNMSSHSAPDIKNVSSDQEFTSVSFEPDLPRFGLTSLTPDIVLLLKKRVYDLAGINSKVKVYLNGERIKIKNFVEYVKMYLPEKDESQVIYDKEMASERWEVIVGFSDGQFKQVSFVNSICTSRGGTHVNNIIDKIVEKLQEQIKKRHKNIEVKPYQIKSNLWVFVNSLIENPAFDSQTKETLTTKPSQFGSKCELSDKFIKEILKTGIIDQIVLQAQAREQAALARTMKGQKKARLLGIPKLEDANDAGTKYAEQCTLILTEGDSAKNLAMAGMEVVGRDNYGVFPLRGKLLNVRDASSKQILENQEIQSLIKIIGLQVGKNYENIKDLRYGSIMIMTDQDTDGSHIKGLIINFINHFWPSLFKTPNFLKEFITPILKATKGNQVLSFFTVQDFKNWAQNRNIKNWKIKYYKGLGTSTDKEAKEYFTNILDHRIKFQYEDQQDDQAIDLVFSHSKADERKAWLANYNPDIFVDHNIKQLRYSDFVNKEMIHFSIDDNLRSIPSLLDGLKPGQRKILFACFKRNLKDEIKVAQLSGYVAEHSAYHHGEISLAQTIIGMAQNFVGSNNINLLLPIGQFGSRNMGGKEHASARYLHTSMSKLTRYIFPEADDHIVKYLEDDNQPVEPRYYLPIIPMVLINGAEGIGTGWSTFVPQYNPLDIVQNIKDRLEGKINQFNNILPWYKGFVGEIIPEGNRGYIVKGKFEAGNEADVLDIKELPIQKWTREYKNFLEKFLEANEKGDEKNPILDDLKEYHAQNRIHFQLKFNQNILQDWMQSNQIEKKLKLVSNILTTNMVLFDQDMKLKKYENVGVIMEEFYQLRLPMYQKRKEYLISKLQRDVEILENKMKFIDCLINEELKIKNEKKEKILKQMIQLKFTPIQKITKIQSTKPEKKDQSKEKSAEGEDINNEQEEEEEQEQQIDNDNDSDDINIQNQNQATKKSNQDEILIKTEIKLTDFSYLLNMSMWSITYEKFEELKKQVKEKNEELQILLNTTKETMWKNDLEQFLIVYDQVLKEEELEQQKQVKGKGNFAKNDKGKKQKKVNNNNKEKNKEKDHKKEGNKKQKQKKQLTWDESEESSESNSNASDDSFIAEIKPEKVKKNQIGDENKNPNLKNAIQNKVNQGKSNNETNQIKPDIEQKQNQIDIPLEQRIMILEKNGSLPQSYYEAYNESKIKDNKEKQQKQFDHTATLGQAQKQGNLMDYMKNKKVKQINQNQEKQLSNQKQNTKIDDSDINDWIKQEINDIVDSDDMKPKQPRNYKIVQKENNLQFDNPTTSTQQKQERMYLKIKDDEEYSIGFKKSKNQKKLQIYSDDDEDI